MERNKKEILTALSILGMITLDGITTMFALSLYLIMLSGINLLTEFLKLTEHPYINIFNEVSGIGSILWILIILIFLIYLRIKGFRELILK